MIKGGKGGASTKTGLLFEQRLDFKKVLGDIDGYKIVGDEILFKEMKVAQFIGKYNLYKNFLDIKGVDWSKIVSKRLLPDEALYIYGTGEVHIVEMKFQNAGGSVDEKLQTCDFKIKQYRKLLKPLEINVHYTYILNDWFKQDCYKDVLEYIRSVGCNYYFNELPLEYLGLPRP